MASAELRWPDKDPADTLDFDLDFTEALPDADTIQTATVTIAPVTVPALTLVQTSIDASGKIVTAWLSAGLDGTEYEVTVQATTGSSPARVIERTVLLRVREL